MADIREILQSKRTCAVLCGQGKYCDNCTDAADELEQLIKEKQVEAVRDNTESILKAYRSSTGIKDDIFTRSLDGKK